MPIYWEKWLVIYVLVSWEILEFLSIWKIKNPYDSNLATNKQPCYNIIPSMCQQRAATVSQTPASAATALWDMKFELIHSVEHSYLSWFGSAVVVQILSCSFLSLYQVYLVHKQQSGPEHWEQTQQASTNSFTFIDHSISPFCHFLLFIGSTDLEGEVEAIVFNLQQFSSYNQAMASIVNNVRVDRLDTFYQDLSGGEPLFNVY